jgi:hypothetical protein
MTSTNKKLGMPNKLYLPKTVPAKENRVLVGVQYFFAAKNPVILSKTQNLFFLALSNQFLTPHPQNLTQQI